MGSLACKCIYLCNRFYDFLQAAIAELIYKTRLFASKPEKE